MSIIEMIKSKEETIYLMEKAEGEKPSKMNKHLCHSVQI